MTSNVGSTAIAKGRYNSIGFMLVDDESSASYGGLKSLGMEELKAYFGPEVSFELEPGAVGQVTDFKEQNKKVEWGLKKIVGGSEHTLRAKLTFSRESTHERLS
ncbi:hypothetical protein Tco_0484912 [Tanacetum coccineum]